MSRALSLARAIGSDGVLNVGDVAGLAAVASSGSASDLGTGTLPNARLASGAAVANLGYTPVNRAGDNLTGGSFQLSSFITLQASDANGYPRINGASSSAQLGLFRSAGGTEGGMYLGADGSNFSVWDQNFNRRLIVDQSGRVTTPAQPAFCADAYPYGVNQTVSAEIPFNSSTTSGFGVALNNGNNFNSVNGRFTAPVAGMYCFSGEYSRNGGNAVTYFLINGSTSRARNLSYGNDWQTSSSSCVIYLNAGDYVVFQYGATNGTTVASYNVQFSGHLVG